MEEREQIETLELISKNVDYLENRIALLDNKVSIISATLGVLFGILYFLINEIYNDSKVLLIKHTEIIVIITSFILLMISIFLLIQTIRPTPKFITIKMKFERYDTPYKIMWFDKSFPSTQEEYSGRIEKIKYKDYLEDYKRSHFILLHHMKQKYSVYRWAIFFTKIFILFSTIGVIALMFIKICFEKTC